MVIKISTILTVTISLFLLIQRRCLYSALGNTSLIAYVVISSEGVYRSLILSRFNGLNGVLL